MCNFQKLYCSNQGYVVRCKSCDCYHIAFYTTVITLSEKNFQHLIKVLEERIRLIQNEAEENFKSIYLPSPTNGFGFTLTILEAQSFSEMLHYADAENKTQTLLSSLGISSIKNPLS